MKISICAIGRMKAGAERDLVEDYLKRARGLGRTVGISAIECADAPESPLDQQTQRIVREAETFRKLMPQGAFVIALDATGKMFSTEDLSVWLQQRLAGGTSQLAFLIGGPDGHAPETLKNAGLVLSLGAMTWPHRLVRVMLVEQIYRSVTIIANHPYHRS